MLYKSYFPQDIDKYTGHEKILYDSGFVEAFPLAEMVHTKQWHLFYQLKN